MPPPRSNYLDQVEERLNARIDETSQRTNQHIDGLNQRIDTLMGMFISHTQNHHGAKSQIRFGAIVTFAVTIATVLIRVFTGFDLPIP